MRPMVFLLSAYLPERYKNTTESKRKVNLVKFGRLTKS